MSDDTTPWVGQWGVFETKAEVHTAPSGVDQFIAGGHILHESCRCGPIVDDEGPRRLLKHMDVDLTR